jgi:hypothetical protein
MIENACRRGRSAAGGLGRVVVGWGGGRWSNGSGCALLRSREEPARCPPEAVPGVGRGFFGVRWGVGGWWSNGSGFALCAAGKSRQDAPRRRSRGLAVGLGRGGGGLVVGGPTGAALRLGAAVEEPARYPPEAVPGVGRWFCWGGWWGWRRRGIFAIVEAKFFRGEVA